MPEIETARLRLRPFSPDDLDNLYQRVYSDPAVMRFLPGGVPRSREETAAVLESFINHWEEHGFGVWAVWLREGGDFIGQCGLQFIPHTDVVELLYAFGPEYWGNGYATEATHASLRYGFEEHHLGWVVALSHPDNFASRRVMLKIGMRFGETTNRYYDTELVTYFIPRGGFDPASHHYELRG